ncbi:NUDIX hydrolase [Rossellomorea vietnamensis]|uniref:NUDIX hydrolase n=1 Tax=Rossellomorea vietnamensis TaxID=218284 RepID=A0A5D4NR87_9BACI|nr:NUDIX hydrolase [Rossellomorea vietnamensis]
MSKTSGCFTIIVNQRGQLLLAKRKDYPLWDLPRGRLDQGEQFEECAIREAREETGNSIFFHKRANKHPAIIEKLL